MRVLLLLTALWLGACAKGGGGGGGGPTCGSKALFSLWDYNGSFFLNLSGGEFDTVEIFTIQYATGEMCQMNFTTQGTECEGTMALTNAAYTGGGSGDPGCSTWNGVFSYTKSNSGLHICDSGGCLDFN